MNLFCKHKWETLNTYDTKVFEDPNATLPIKVRHIIEQQCEKCGKQIIRKYRTV